VIARALAIARAAKELAEPLVAQGDERLHAQ
jgi:hypothetical protein